MTRLLPLKLRRDGLPAIQFRGRLISSVSSFRGSSMWTKLDLYKSEHGTLLVHEIGKSNKEGHRDLFKVYVAATTGELIEKVGRGSLAQELYREAMIEDVVKLEDLA